MTENGTTTPLAQRLSAAANPKPDAIDAFRLARRLFLAGERVDMQELAAELGISRATLFRWVGNRNQLLAEVVWSLAEPTMDRAIAGARGRGARRIADIVERFTRDLIESDNFRRYLIREPEAALRLLTTRASVVQLRLVALVEELLEREAAVGAIDPPMDPHDLAYLIVRIGESFSYADIITGEEPDATKVGVAVAALLGANDESRT